MNQNEDISIKVFWIVPIKKSTVNFFENILTILTNRKSYLLGEDETANSDSAAVIFGSFDLVKEQEKIIRFMVLVTE